ncbi:MAG TPA: exodeoxyribonuclease VII large subunit, partial [Anaerolineae bacterium]
MQESLFDLAPTLTVTQLARRIKEIVEDDLTLSDAWVRGEISNFTHATSGHLYFSLKDREAAIRCVMWRTDAARVFKLPANGDAVQVHGRVSMYEARGDVQLYVDEIKLAGAGALWQEFERLRARLDAEGLFAAERKRGLPQFPRRIGVVTSREGAVFHDICNVLRRRYPLVEILLAPTLVQGGTAAPQIAKVIESINRCEIDLLIVARGGGSIEDLWAFNEEAVARAVHDSVLPIVAGIGHETDFTICDFVADLRAPTPTGAATAVTPDRTAIAHRVAQVARRIARGGEHALALRLQRVDAAARRLVHPAAYLAAQGDRAQALARRLAQAWHSRRAARDVAAAALSARLLRELRSPLPQSLHLTRARADWLRQGRDHLSGIDARLR